MAGPTCKIVGVSLCFAHGGGIRIRVKSHHPEFSLFYCGKRFLGRSTAAANAAAIVVCVVVIIMEVLPVKHCGDFSLCRDYLIKKTEFRIMTFHSNPNTMSKTKRDSNIFSFWSRCGHQGGSKRKENKWNIF